MKKIKLSKIPSIFKNVNLSNEVKVSDTIQPKEGAFVVVEALENEGKKDDLDFANGRLGKVVKGDIIAGSLGFRKASVEFAGIVPKSVELGDKLYLLCESGLIGEISGVYQAWGAPMKVKVLGAIVDETDKQMSLKNFKLPEVKPTKAKIPVIAFLGTRMDCGKTTMARKIAHYFNQKGKKVAAIKVTGVAFTQDLYQLREYGADPVVDFVDMGLPSTCNEDAESVVDSAINLVNYCKSLDPDLILVEFGDSIIGEYHVAEVLKAKQIKEQISLVVLAGFDFAGVDGAKLKLEELGYAVDMVTGPVVNSQVGVDLVKKYFNLEAESNQLGIPKTIKLVKRILAENL